MATTIFLAGASGAIGRRLGPLLVAAGHRVHGTTRSPARASTLETLSVTPVVLDVYDAEATRRALAAVRPEVVIHQLTDLPAGMRTDDMAAALARNTRLREIGTANLVAGAIAAGTVRRLIAQSLAFAYAPGPLPHAEADPIDPAAHGVISLESQVGAAPFAGVVLRYGRLWGPGTGFDAPADACPVHVDAAARAAQIAVTQGSGTYNIAEDTGEVSTERARTDLGWDPSWRLRD